MRVLIRLKPGLWVPESRYVMEQKLGRPLDPREHVFHRNGDPTDNRPENLKLVVRKRPNLWRDCECGCGMRIRTYGKDNRRRRFVWGHNARLRGRAKESSGGTTSDAGSGLKVVSQVRTGRGDLLPGYGSLLLLERREA